MQTGRKYFTIVRNGVIRQKPHGAHHCGYGWMRKFPYRVTVCVKGELTAPDYFVVANEAIDNYVQAVFVRNRVSQSCEKMCDDICLAVFSLMQQYSQWQTEHIHVELTGTRGRALLSCDWYSKAVEQEAP